MSTRTRRRVPPYTPSKSCFTIDESSRFSLKYQRMRWNYCTFLYRLFNDTVLNIPSILLLTFCAQFVFVPGELQLCDIGGRLALHGDDRRDSSSGAATAAATTTHQSSETGVTAPRPPPEPPSRAVLVAEAMVEIKQKQEEVKERFEYTLRSHLMHTHTHIQAHPYTPAQPLLVRPWFPMHTVYTPKFCVRGTQ